MLNLALVKKSVRPILIIEYTISAASVLAGSGNCSKMYSILIETFRGKLQINDAFGGAVEAAFGTASVSRLSVCRGKVLTAHDGTRSCCSGWRLADQAGDSRIALLA